MVMLALWFVLVGGLVLYRFVVRAYLPVVGTDLDAFQAIYGAPATESARRLYSAYLSRARRYRSTWSAVGWGAAIFLATQFRPAGITFGPGKHPVYADLLFMGFGGYLLGAIAAELHHLRGRATGVRTASLEPRRAARDLPAHEQMQLRIVAIAAVVASVGYCIVHATSAEPEPFSWAVVVYGASVVLVLLVVEVAARAVVHRARPALPEDVARGDDAIRSAAAQTLVTGGSGFVLLVLSWSASGASGTLRGGWQSVYAALAVAALIGAVRLAFRTRRLAWPSRKIVVEGVRA